MTSDIQFYIELLKKRLPVMVVIFTICAGLGLGMAFTMPPKFVASAVLSVEGAKISDELVFLTTETEGTEDLQIIQQQLLARGNVIDVANKFRVFADEPGLTSDEVVDNMREMTEISLAAGRNLVPTLSISFTSGDPNVSANVVNEFVTFVLAADAERRRDKSGGTLEFFERRVENLTQRLASQSAAIVTFKEANADALPEGLSYRMSRQAALQERNNLIGRDLVSLREQRARLLSLGPGGAVLTPEQQQLQELEAELRWKLSVFSDANPKVRVLQSRIEQLKEQMANVTEAADAGLTTTNSVLDLQIAEIDSRIQSLSEENRVTEIELAGLQTAIEATPQVGIELGKLEREYENTQTLYAQAVSSRAAAEQGVAVEDGGASSKIVVIEQATVPTGPSSPNRKLIAGGGVFAGGALAGLFFVLTELFNRTIRRPVDLIRGLGVQPLATLPYLEEEAVRKRRRFLKIGFVMLALIAIPLAFWAIHVFYLPLDLLFEQVGSKIGL